MVTLACGIIVHPKDIILLGKKIYRYIPFFDEIHIAIDSDPNKAIHPVNWIKYFTGCHIVKTNLDNDFARFRNKVMLLNNCDWIFFLDADEDLSTGFRKNIRKLVDMIDGLNDPVDMCGFPRINYFGGKILYETYPDVQWRLIRRHVRWINNSPYPGASPGLHETPAGLNGYQSVFAEGWNILHIKTQEKQDDCVKQWQEIRALHQ